MKKIVIIKKRDKNLTKKQLFIQKSGLVLSDITSIIDLPNQIRDIFINNDQITFKAISWCIFPIIWAGDIIKIKPTTPEEIKIGDIVLYKSEGRAYAHRLVKIYTEKDKTYIATSGEKEYRSKKVGGDIAIPLDSILGKVIEVRRGKVCFRPEEVKLSPVSLIWGRMKNVNLEFNVET